MHASVGQRRWVPRTLHPTHCIGLPRRSRVLPRTLELSQLPPRYQRRSTMALHSQADDDDAELAETQQLLATSSAAPTPPYDVTMTALCFLFPAIGGALFGYDIGATSGALVSLTNPSLSGTTWGSALSAFQSGLVVSCSLFGALGGSLGALLVGDDLGRRKELLLAAACYGVGAAVMGSALSLGVLLAGHTLYGIGIGFAMHAAPAYIAETAPANVRGLLISLKEAFIVGGILLGYLSSYAFVETVGGWRWMYGISAGVAVVLAAGMAWLPESPRWLLLSGAGTPAAKAALTRVKGRVGQDAAAVAREVQEVQAALASDVPAATKMQGFAALTRPPNLQPLLIGMSLMLFQQITGQPSVLYYAAAIFQSAGFASASEATRIAVVLGLFKLLMTAVAVLTVDRLGRRPLLLAGVSGMVAALIALSLSTGSLEAAAAHATATAVNPMLATVSVIALLLYVGCYQVSFGPISWLLVGEIFPLAVRGPALALATITNFGSNFLVSLVLPAVQEGFGLAGTYALFAAIGVLAVASIAATVPETKGKTLEEIQAMWENRGG